MDKLTEAINILNEIKDKPESPRESRAVINSKLDTLLDTFGKIVEYQNLERKLAEKILGMKLEIALEEDNPLKAAAEAWE